jgi:MFS family permease
MRFSPAQRRYNRRVLVLSVVYAALLFPTVYLLSRHLVAGPLAYVVGVLPALAVSGFFWLMGRYLIEETDEYLRMLQIRQLLIATGIALTAATIWGFLEGFDLVRHVVGYAWPIVYFVGLAIGAGVNRLIERRAA